MVENQDPDNFPCFLAQKWCAWELAAYVFKKGLYFLFIFCSTVTCEPIGSAAAIMYCINVISVAVPYAILIIKTPRDVTSQIS